MWYMYVRAGTPQAEIVHMTQKTATLLILWLPMFDFENFWGKLAAVTFRW